MPRESAGRPLREATPPADHESGAHKVAKDRRLPTQEDKNELEAMFAELAEDFDTTPIGRGVDSDGLEADLPGVGDEFDPITVVRRVKGINEQIARIKANESRVGAKVKQREEARLARKGDAEPAPSPSADLELADEVTQEISQKMAKSRADKKAYTEERARVKPRGEKVASANFAKMKKDFPLGRRYDVAIGAPVPRMDSELLEYVEESTVKPLKRNFPLGRRQEVAIGAPEHFNGVPVRRVDSSFLEDLDEDNDESVKRVFPLGRKGKVAIGAPEHIDGMPVQRLDSSLLEDDVEETVAKSGRVIPQIPNHLRKVPSAPRSSERSFGNKSRKLFVPNRDQVAIGAPKVPEKTVWQSVKGFFGKMFGG